MNFTNKEVLQFLKMNLDPDEVAELVIRVGGLTTCQVVNALERWVVHYKDSIMEELDISNSSYEDQIDY